MKIDLDALRERLPQNPGIATGERHPQFVVFVPLILVEGEHHMLFEVRAKGIRQEGEVCFPGGRHEPESDASVEETALRETEEELGIARAKLRILGRLHSIVTHWGALIHVCAGEVHDISPAELSLNQGEVERVLSVPFSFFASSQPERYQVRVETQPWFVDEEGRTQILFPARELGLPRRYWNAWGAQMRPVYLYRYQGDVIWGITAEVIRDFVAAVS